MRSRAKTFDCVEMKHNAQKKLRAEYERRKEEFASFFEFLDAKAAESQWQQDFWANVDPDNEASR